MSTVRLQIVDAIAAALATATGLTVYRNLDYALEDSNLPALVVASGEEQVSDRMIGKIDHQVMLDIAVLIAGSATPESAADPYEAQIHAALFGATSFGGFPLGRLAVRPRRLLRARTALPVHPHHLHDEPGVLTCQTSKNRTRSPAAAMCATRRQAR